jgi:hypothetical protein
MPYVEQGTLGDRWRRSSSPSAACWRNCTECARWIAVALRLAAEHLVEEGAGIVMSESACPTSCQTTIDC